MEEGTKNKMVYEYFRVANASVLGLLHKCPYTFVNFTNQAIKVDEIPSIFPSGDYKGILNYFTERRKLMIASTSIVTVTSSVKESFGK
ncbi:CLUMA_CG017093, isoform A [Clunio marinus]|uniref:CLUMA_CG017093, isoform A n=1 Tax=Clunio marinus TaxID=568069 RepID=A0A1J1IWM8_9DIPT|nr:CLUMA_CG017093, isoform A [Clunio marinus]